jgi:probable biosynthetic protein (TIGR04098 family)
MSAAASRSPSLRLEAACAPAAAPGAAERGARADLPAAPRRIRVGMPHLDAAGLSEGWLFRYAGDLHWEAIARRLGVATDAIRDGGDRRLYPAVVALRARYSATPAAVVENDVLDASVEVVPCGRACAHGRVVAGVADADRRFTLELLTTFVAREPDGVMRMAPPAPALARRWLAGADVDAAGPASRVAIARLARAARRGEPVDDPLLAPLLARVGRPAIGVVEHEPSPYADYNGAGLLYFASYVTLADGAERRLVRRLGLAPEAAARGRDWALAASAVRRDVFFYENLPLGAPLEAALLAFDADARGVTTHVRLRRRAEEGGRSMADVVTRRLFVGAPQERP